MDTMSPASGFHERLEQLDELIQESERSSDPAVRAQVREIVRALMDLHRTALERLFEHVAGAGSAGRVLREVLAQDEVVGGMLLLYGLHPHDLETRVRRGLATASAHLQAHGGDLALESIDGDAVRLRLLKAESCSVSPAVLRSVVERAILDTAPDVVRVEIEGLEDMKPAALVQLGMLHVDGAGKPEMAVQST